MKHTRNKLNTMATIMGKNPQVEEQKRKFYCLELLYVGFYLILFFIIILICIFLLLNAKNIILNFALLTFLYFLISFFSLWNCFAARKNPTQALQQPHLAILLCKHIHPNY